MKSYFVEGREKGEWTEVFGSNVSRLKEADALVEKLQKEMPSFSWRIIETTKKPIKFYQPNAEISHRTSHE